MHACGWTRWRPLEWPGQHCCDLLFEKLWLLDILLLPAESTLLSEFLEKYEYNFLNVMRVSFSYLIKQSTEKDVGRRYSLIRSANVAVGF